MCNFTFAVPFTFRGADEETISLHRLRKPGVISTSVGVAGHVLPELPYSLSERPTGSAEQFEQGLRQLEQKTAGIQSTEF